MQNLEKATGRSFDDWVETARRSGLEKHGQLVSFLKEAHGLTHGYANLVVHMLRSGGNGATNEGEPRDAIFAGKKAALRPQYDELEAKVREFGSDVEVAPKKTYVSLRRKKQFALIQPSTATRLDVGLNLKGLPAGDRLEDSAGFTAMCSHRVRINLGDPVDAEVVEWLRAAYERAG